MVISARLYDEHDPETNGRTLKPTVVAVSDSQLLCRDSKREWGRTLDAMQPPVDSRFREARTETRNGKSDAVTSPFWPGVLALSAARLIPERSHYPVFLHAGNHGAARQA